MTVPEEEAKELAETLRRYWQMAAAARQPSYTDIRIVLTNGKEYSFNPVPPENAPRIGEYGVEIQDGPYRRYLRWSEIAMVELGMDE